MTRPMRHPRNTPATTTLACLSAAMLVVGCAQQTTSSVSRPAVQPRTNDIYQNRSPEVVRYDRYTLVSTRPADSQRDPLNQMIDITMPPQLVRSVGDGFRYLLLESGYSLCPSSSSMFTELLSRPLPGVQRSIGPVRLSEALQIVAGPAWRLRVDDVNREVCFVLRDEYRSFAPTVPSLPTSPVKSVVSATPRTSGNPFTNPGAQTKSGMLKPDSQPLPVPTLTTLSPTATESKPSAAAQTAPLSALPSPVKSSVAPAPAAKSILAPTTALPPAPVAQPPKKDETAKLLSTSSKTSPAVSAPVVPTPVVSPALASEPKSAPVITPVWKADPGTTTLREFLTRQASTVDCPYGGKWAVVWPINVDYPLPPRLVIHGSFDAFVNRIFYLYGPERVDTPLYGLANRSQCVVVVSDKPLRTGLN
ncbi:TcpQ domain-containing protein [Pectobacterium punjabense]|uniref:PFGI-1 class ICE element type IV pilus protein PilL2 n=1 Tax=Pectobacterium punjabense TaxID=2108399 RepID=UPI003C7079FF